MMPGFSRQACLPLALALLVAPVPAAGAPGGAITKSEIRIDDPYLTHRRIRDSVWTMFQQQDLRLDKQPTLPLTRLFLETRVRATHFPGLCRYDSVRVDYEPDPSKKRGPDTPARPVGLNATSHYAFVSPPGAENDYRVEISPALSRECDMLPTDHPFFIAEDETTATEGYRAWLALMDAMAKGAKVPLDCHLYPVDKEPCDAVIRSLRRDELDRVEDCDAESGTLCHKLYVGDRLLTVTTTGRVYPGPPAGQLVGAKLDSLIILVHELRD